MLYICGMIFFILSFFVGYILSFGLVRLRTIRLSAWVRAHIEHRCSRSLEEDVTITDVIIKSPDRKWAWRCDWRHARKRWAEDFWKRSVSWDLKLDEASWFLDLGEASPVGSTRCAVRCWVRWNSQHSKIVSLSSRVENLKVKKVINVSYLNYRESSVFRAFFGFLCLWTFYTSVYLTYVYISYILIMDILQLVVWALCVKLNKVHYILSSIMLAMVWFGLVWIYGI